MSRDGAMTRARALARELEALKVPVSIELQQGRPGTPNSQWFDVRFIGTMGHHTVSRRSMGMTPTLGLIKRGRPDVPGPLCNAYLGFDGRARIICMGWANHPGAGGPLSLPGGRIPKDGARPYLFGWEIEGGLDDRDWPASFHDLMARCLAATLNWLGRDERSHVEHSTWTYRKIDRLGYTAPAARQLIKPYIGASQQLPDTGKEDDDMPYRDWPSADKKALADDLIKALWNAKNTASEQTFAAHVRRGDTSRRVQSRVSGDQVQLTTVHLEAQRRAYDAAQAVTSPITSHTGSKLMPRRMWQLWHQWIADLRADAREALTILREMRTEQKRSLSAASSAHAAVEREVAAAERVRDADPLPVVSEVDEPEPAEDEG